MIGPFWKKVTLLKCKLKVKKLHIMLTQMTWFYKNFSSLIILKWWNKSLSLHRQKSIDLYINEIWDVFALLTWLSKNLLLCPLAHLSSIHYIKGKEAYPWNILQPTSLGITGVNERCLITVILSHWIKMILQYAWLTAHAFQSYRVLGK